MRAALVLFLASSALADVAVGQPHPSPNPNPQPELFATLDKKGLLTELRLQDGTQVLWRRAPPEPVTFARSKSGPARLLGYPFATVQWFRDNLVVALRYHIWIFGRSDGKTLLSHGVPEVGFGSLMFDRAHVVISYTGSPSCNFDAVDSRFVASCGTRLVDYTGSGIAVFDSEPYKLRAAWMVPDVEPLGSDGAWHLEVGGTKIIIHPIH